MREMTRLTAQEIKNMRSYDPNVEGPLTPTGLRIWQAICDLALTARSEGFREDAGQEWRVTENGNLICSEDFTFDAMLKLDGDFADEAQRIQYAEAIAGKLNALSPREKDASSPPPPERP